MNLLTKRDGSSWAGPLLILVLCGTVSADDEYQKMVYVRVGDYAPAIDLKDDQGNTWLLNKHVGKKNIVVFFYLGDFMPSCTKQAAAYRDTLKKLEAYGVEVIGISGDSVSTHAKFKETNRLNFALLADVDGEATNVYGVAASGPSSTKVKDSKGKTTTYQRNITASRWTWVIGKDGRVVYKNICVKPEEDAKKVLEFFEKEAAEARNK